MSGAANADLVPTPDLAADEYVAVIYAGWHKEIVQALLKGAEHILSQSKVTPKEVEVPGCYELPLACHFALKDSKCRGVVALGCIIQGETIHDKLIAYPLSEKLLELSLAHERPIGFGVIVAENISLAKERAGLTGDKEDKGREAALAVLHMLELKNNIHKPRTRTGFLK